MAKELGIGDFSHDGMLQITDTNWNSNGTLRVTVREMVGQKWSDYPGGQDNVIRRARTLARRALPEYYKGQTKSSKVIRTWFAQGSSHVTFAVSRN